MNIIVSSWKNSLTQCHPRVLALFFVSAMVRFYRALKVMLRSFGALFLVDISLLGIFGSFFISFFSSHTLKAPGSVPGVLAIALFALEVNWFVLNVIMILFIRKKDGQSPVVYVKRTFMVVLKLLFWSYLIAFLGLSFMIMLGIFTVPTLHWSVVVLFAFMKYLVLFYWLNDTSGFKNFCLAIEKSINCFFYNLPFVFVLLFTIWVLNWIICWAFLGGTSGQVLMCFFEKADSIIKTYGKTLTVTTFIVLRYVGFLIKHLWISLIFIFFDQKKDIIYADSCFDISNKTQHPE